MTSSRKSRRSRKPIIRRALVALGALGAFGIALYAFFVLSPVRLDPAASHASVEKAMAQLKQGNASAARQSALDAVRSDPNSADAHLLLARTQLQLGEGVAAEAEIKRANDAGVDPKLTHHLLGDALQLQGQNEKAIDEVEKTDPKFRNYGLRIRARAMTALGNYADAKECLEEAARIAPRDGDVWTDIGRFRFTVGDISGAIAASQRAVELDGDNVDALELRGELVRTQYGLVAALPWFERALARDPWHHDTLIEYAATLGDAGRTNDMLAATRKALEAKPGSPQAFYLQAVLAARAGNYDLARTLAEKTGGTIDTLPGMLLLTGTLDLQEGDTEQALGKLQALVAQQPMNITARKLLAVALLRSDAARNALDVLRPVALRGDADSYTLTLVARGFERIGDRDIAARFLDRAAFPGRGGSGAFSADDSLAILGAPAQERPNDPTAVIPLVRGLVEAGNSGAALARAQQMVSDNPGVPGAYVLLGDVLMVQGRSGDAATAYKQAADLRFDEPTMLRLVEALGDAGRRGEASQTLALFLSQNPVNLAALRISAHWQLVSGDYDAAIVTLEGLHDRIGDGDAALNADLATAYAGAGEAETARQYGEAAYALAPGNPAAADSYGWALYQSGDDQGALELLQKAVLLAPRHSGLRWHLAQIYAEMKRPNEARAHLQAALADPLFADRGAAQVLLGKLG
ncbi:tetratricopeptide repeat protein [Sphingomonas sp. LB-2]|uniref:tetratricopeptide repeat protein n=1 Tax=Sphingomonas caeni TaxID=2984949 RepID=UPI00222E5B7A|nr:tetratricopeptide repeat protein [Sphingomonas caeni]MCW3847196.1 tetratricopeptide repeat protein [Sphingomonas caeni]